jgi:hypothetical protein
MGLRDGLLAQQLRPSRPLQERQGGDQVSGIESEPQRPFAVGDFVVLPNGSVATVVHLAVDGDIAVETPWSAQWQRFSPGALRRIGLGRADG